MRALCVDDEIILLEVLKLAVEASPDIEETTCFTSAQNALQWAESNPVDIAFLDIQIHQMSGLTLAERLKEMHPGLPIVFCTGYDQYAMEAFQLHALGYLTKPIYAKDVQEQINQIKLLQERKVKENKKLRVECFGNFEVYYEDTPIIFKRKKSKELLAYLIDRQGATVSLDQIAVALWEEYENKRNIKNYFHQVLHHLKVVLKEIGFGQLILSRVDGYAVDKRFLDCDYYRYLHNDAEAIKMFQGEYMFQYSWAEETCAQLAQMQYDASLKI